MKITINTDKSMLKLKGGEITNEVFDAYNLMVALIHHKLEIEEANEQRREEVVSMLTKNIEFAILGKKSNNTIDKEFKKIFE